MKMYQIVMRSGLTKNVEAETYCRERNRLVFRIGGTVVLLLKCGEAIMIDELCGESFGVVAETHG